jgi:hypothetical protein
VNRRPPLTPQQQAQQQLQKYLHTFGHVYRDPKHPDHVIVTEEVRELSRAAAGPDADKPI